MTVFAYHTAIDAALGRFMANTPKDQQPCCSTCTSPHCCSEPAYADALEIDAMLGLLTPEQRDHVSAAALRWWDLFSHSRLIDEELPNAFAYRNLNLPCPFLKAGRCLAYAARPMGCREFFAIGNPEDCAMPMRIHQKFAGYPHPNQLDQATLEFAVSNGVELDHIGAHLVRKLLNEPEFTTGSHQRFEITTNEPAHP